MKCIRWHGQQRDIFDGNHMGSGVRCIQVSRFENSQRELLVFHGQVDSDFTLFDNKDQILIMLGSIDQLPFAVSYFAEFSAELVVFLTA
jgi:hypothetical protein